MKKTVLILLSIFALMMSLVACSAGDKNMPNQQVTPNQSYRSSSHHGNHHPDAHH